MERQTLRSAVYSSIKNFLITASWSRMDFLKGSPNSAATPLRNAKSDEKLGVGINRTDTSSRASKSVYKYRRMVDLPIPTPPNMHVNPCRLLMVYFTLKIADLMFGVRYR